MQNHQSNDGLVTWVVALILAALLTWMYFNGQGPQNSCCAGGSEATLAVMPEASTATPQAFGFAATSESYQSVGDARAIEWAQDVTALKQLLAGGLRAEGSQTAVVLSGTVGSEAIKQQKGTEAQNFFGAAVTVDNQLTVQSVEPVAPTPTPAAAVAPAAKLYFEVSQAALPTDASTTLAPIVDWLNANPSSKAVLSGYHDATGDPVANAELAKNRAKAVRDAIKVAGIDESRIEMRKPQVVDGGADLTEARRVEVSIE